VHHNYIKLTELNLSEPILYSSTLSNDVNKLKKTSNDVGWRLNGMLCERHIDQVRTSSRMVSPERRRARREMERYSVFVLIRKRNQCDSLILNQPWNIFDPESSSRSHQAGPTEPELLSQSHAATRTRASNVLVEKLHDDAILSIKPNSAHNYMGIWDK
jgi:hypothetical protein